MVWEGLSTIKGQSVFYDSKFPENELESAFAFYKLRNILAICDASVKSTLPSRFWSVAGAAARADSWFLQRFSDFWRLHPD